MFSATLHPITPSSKEAPITCNSHPKRDRSHGDNAPAVYAPERGKPFFLFLVIYTSKNKEAGPISFKVYLEFYFSNVVYHLAAIPTSPPFLSLVSIAIEISREY
jgi:hypothetical protein